ncbi:Long-chain-fatty-acid--CoA ligase 5 [Toxocara canis]|uniref:Long-chain-fatty-acid--CoA ligase n=1 Tax=Toxocara canis TaxID=6265 RepID=A0A0B2VF78_TOXCA|nr:Long-chain-fatty-acid--CoA ligase 5 [Toxocara canis]
MDASSIASIFAGDSLKGVLISWCSFALAGITTISASLTAYWYLSGASYPKLKKLMDIKRQTKILKDGSRVAACLENDRLQSRNFDDSLTILQAVQRGLRVSNNGPMLAYRKQKSDGTKPYVWLTYKEWIIGELAAYHYSNIVVSLYDTLGPDTRTFIINQTGTKIVICDDEQKLKSLIDEAPKLPSLKHIIVIESYSEELQQMAENVGITLHRFHEVEEMGQQLMPKPTRQPPTPEDLSTVCYTSGTTGMPKGVMLTHANVIAATTCLRFIVNVDVNTEDVMISYLPLAHMYERMLECACFQVGGRVGYFSGDIRTLADDAKQLRPTVFPLVPRVLNRIYDKIMSEVNKSLIKRFLFAVALAYKTSELRRGILRTDSFFDKIVFKKIRDQLGGRVRFMTTGSAPIAPDVLTFARAAFGCIVIEGYGQTECVAACSNGLEADFDAGHVGIPILCNAVKLFDVPELNYYAKDQVGEVCIRGNNVFKGYYKNEKATEETLDENGWLHSGDIGRWTENGTLKIIDRKKHIFKLQQGEYIAPDKIENVYAHSAFVAQSFIYGESLKTCLVGIIVPDEEELQKLASSQPDLDGATFEELCRNQTVKKLILADLIKTGKKQGLLPFEQVKDIYVTSERFTMENDLLTPTLKNKRPNLKRHFQTHIQQMYSQLN